MMDGSYGFGHAGGGFIGIIFWIIVIVAVIAVFRMLMDSRSNNMDSRSNSGNASKSALDILNERYARGEINQQEYEQKKRDITGESGE